MKKFGIALIALALVACNSNSTPLKNEILETIDEVVVENDTCDKNSGPVCGEIQIQCITTPCNPVQETLKNECEAEKRDAKILYNGACIENESQSEEDENKPSSSLPEGEFAFNEYGNFQGEVYVSGYIKEKTIPEAFCENPCSITYQGVFIQVTDTGNDDFKNFLLENQTKNYVSTDPEKNALAEIMLGCVNEENEIYYSNDSDEYGMAEQVVDGELARDVLAHTDPSKRLVLKLTKLLLSGGRGAPACYSHFYDIELIDSLNRTF